MLSQLVRVPLTSSQVQVVNEIEARFMAAGLPLAWAAGAVVNAYGESGLNPKARSPSGRYLGLFQTSPDHGSEASRLNLVWAVNWAIKKVVPLADHSGYDGSVESAAELFCRRVEIPGDPDLRVRERLKIAALLFGANLSTIANA